MALLGAALCINGIKVRFFPCCRPSLAVRRLCFIISSMHLQLLQESALGIKQAFFTCFAEGSALTTCVSATCANDSFVSTKIGCLYKSCSRPSRAYVAQVPVLETPSGPLFESNAICRFLAEDTPLYARSVAVPDIVRADIDKWVDWCQVRLWVTNALMHTSMQDSTVLLGKSVGRAVSNTLVSEIAR